MAGDEVDEIAAMRKEIADLKRQAYKMWVALEPFAHVAERIRESATDDRWLASVLFYMGDIDDPTKWSLTGRAFDRARAARSQGGGAP